MIITQRRKNANYKISSVDKQIEQAIKNVHAKFGNDLGAFFSAVQDEKVKFDERESRNAQRRSWKDTLQNT